MQYDAFKVTIINKLKEYLPEEYQSWEIKTGQINQVNRTREILQLQPETRPSAVPVLYLDDLYLCYMQGMKIERVLKEAAERFLAGTDYLKKYGRRLSVDNPDGRIIYTLINTEKNSHMLEGIPHREIMDLSVIYRFAAEDSEGGINSFVITDSIADSFQLTEEELYLEAVRNTPVFMPVSVIRAEPMGCVICNKRGILGAATMLYEGVLSKIALLMESDLYILPSSVHEVIAVSAADSSLDDLRNAVMSVNRSVVKPCDFLSDQVYFFDREDSQLKPAVNEQLS